MKKQSEILFSGKKLLVIVVSSAICLSSLGAFDQNVITQRNNIGYKYEGAKIAFNVPDEKTIPNTKFGDLIKYGKELVVHTSKYIGPEVKDEKMRYSGNNLNCQSCHLDAGTKPYAAPFVGLHAAFPAYQAREDEVGTLADRINGCMERSMNGQKLPLGGKEMRALEAYFYWLSQGVPVGAIKSLEGTSLDKVDRKMTKSQAANPDKGKLVYEQQCAVCHQANGEGVKNEGLANGYTYPPLWGADSYNKGAGMFRILKAADYLKNNMPLGATKQNPILTDEEAYNVAAFINLESHDRPEKANRKKDFPDEVVKAPDVYNKGDEIEHKFGPFGKFTK